MKIFYFIPENILKLFKKIKSALLRTKKSINYINGPELLPPPLPHELPRQSLVPRALSSLCPGSVISLHSWQPVQPASPFGQSSVF